MDFEASVSAAILGRRCWRCVSWRTLNEGILERNAYYNHAFRDEGQWLSPMANSPELEVSAITQSAPPDNHMLEFKVHHLRM